MDRAGITVCVVCSRGRIVHRDLYAHGRTLGTETPRYLEEVATVHAFRVLRDWIREYPSGLYNISHIMIYAGTYSLGAAVNRWLAIGTLVMESAAATVLIDEIASMDRWVTRPVGLLPLEFSEGADEWRKMPWIVEEFRTLTEPELGGNLEKVLASYPQKQAGD